MSREEALKTARAIACASVLGISPDEIKERHKTLKKLFTEYDLTWDELAVK